MVHRRSPAASDLARCRCRRGGWWRGGGDLHVWLHLAVLEKKVAWRTRAEGREGEEASAICVHERDWSGASRHHGPTCQRLPSVLAGSHGEKRGDPNNGRTIRFS
jgi:hypothetical protein